MFFKLMFTTLLSLTTTASWAAGLNSIVTLTRHEIAGRVKFEVQCDNGVTEVATVEMLRQDAVCSGPSDFFFDPAMKNYFRLIPGHHSVFDAAQACKTTFGSTYHLANPIELKEAVLHKISDPAVNSAFGYKLSREPIVWTDEGWMNTPNVGYSATIFDFVSGGIQKTIANTSRYTLGVVLCVK